VDAAFFPLALLSGYRRRRHPPKSLLNQRLGLEAPRCLKASNRVADVISAPSPVGHSFIAGYPGRGGPSLLPTYRRLPLSGHCIDLDSCPLTAPDFVLTPWYPNWHHRLDFGPTVLLFGTGVDWTRTLPSRPRLGCSFTPLLQSRLNAAVSPLCLLGLDSSFLLARGFEWMGHGLGSTSIWTVG